MAARYTRRASWTAASGLVASRLEADIGYYAIVGLCGICDATFAANPQKVPCFPVDRRQPPGLTTRLSTTGAKAPVCLGCFHAINDLRRQSNLPPHALPEGAYDAAEEGES